MVPAREPRPLQRVVVKLNIGRGFLGGAADEPPPELRNVEYHRTCYNERRGTTGPPVAPRSTIRLSPTWLKVRDRPGAKSAAGDWGDDLVLLDLWVERSGVDDVLAIDLL